MNDVRILPLRDVPERLQEAAGWFHDKWGIPLQAYLDSMQDCLILICAKVIDTKKEIL